MRGRAGGTIALVAILTACTLGVVDLQRHPAPAVLDVIATVSPYLDDPSRVQVVVDAELDPGIDADGTPRSLHEEELWVEEVAHGAAIAGDPPRFTWTTTKSYSTPGPEGIALRFPIIEGLGLPEPIQMRVRVATTPGDTILLADGEDLVVHAEAPSNPARSLLWTLDLMSSSTAWSARQEGRTSWPEEVRILDGDLPSGAFPIEATLRIRWDRSLDLYDLTPVERYRLDLRTTFSVRWIVVRDG